MYTKVKKALFLLTCYLTLSVITSCTSPEDPAVPYQGLSFSINGLPVSRPGEVYALWLEKPILAAPQQNKPLHGVNLSELVTLFTINSSGEMVGFDTASLYSKFNLLNTILEAEISIEASNVIGANPTNIVMAGNAKIEGNTRSVTLSPFHGFAFGDSLFATQAEVVLASAPEKPEQYKHEFYLMRRDNQQNLSAGLTSFKGLINTWRYGLWVVDSSQLSLKAAFMGHPFVAAGHDTKKALDSYPFPGGRVPADAALEAWDLTSGSMSVLMTLEPVTSLKEPKQPSGLVVLQGKIPAGVEAFTSFSLENKTASLPTGEIKLTR